MTDKKIVINTGKLTDVAERVGWTFAQALGGAVAGASASVGFAGFNWHAALVAAGTAAGLCLLKVLGVNASTKSGKSDEPPAA